MSNLAIQGTLLRSANLILNFVSWTFFSITNIKHGEAASCILLQLDFIGELNSQL